MGLRLLQSRTRAHKQPNPKRPTSKQAVNDIQRPMGFTMLWVMNMNTSFLNVNRPATKRRSSIGFVCVCVDEVGLHLDSWDNCV